MVSLFIFSQHPQGIHYQALMSNPYSSFFSKNTHQFLFKHPELINKQVRFHFQYSSKTLNMQCPA